MYGLAKEGGTSTASVVTTGGTTGVIMNVNATAKAVVTIQSACGAA
jgi:acyl-CoA synthetase (AMP-forming)/AMP-acid ligase II